MPTMWPGSNPRRYVISELNLLLFLVATVWVFQYSFSEKANTDFYTANRSQFYLETMDKYLLCECTAANTHSPVLSIHCAFQLIKIALESISAHSRLVYARSGGGARAHFMNSSW